MSNPQSPPGTDDLTGMLRRWRDGDASAFDELFPRTYDHLRSIAHARLRGERSEHTLSATALVHEAYLRLTTAGSVDWQDRAHFFAVASRAMRRILVDHAKERGAKKRGGLHVRVTFDPARFANMLVASDTDADAVLALDDALERLEAEHPRHARAIELRYFGGLTLDEVGAVLGVSAPTAMRDVRFGQAWLARALGAGVDDSGD